MKREDNIIPFPSVTPPVNEEELWKKFKSVVSTLNTHRIKAGLSLKDIADKCNVSFAYIAALDRGSLICSVEVLNKYANAVSAEITLDDELLDYIHSKEKTINKLMELNML